jgi:lysophospholipase L1-like esterase
VRLSAALLLVLGLVAACSADDPAESRRSRGAQPTATSTGPVAPSSSSPATSPTSIDADVYVAVGASETVGVGAGDPATQAWPRVLHDSVMPDSRYVNVGVSGATVADAVRQQLPRAVTADADVATVWLAVNDLIAGVPVESYAGDLERLLRALRRDGATVLVGNVPRLWQVPVFADCVSNRPADRRRCVLPDAPSRTGIKAAVAEYNAAIARVARATGAVVVDLRGVAVTRDLVSFDGFHPSTEGHRRVARAFEAELTEEVTAAAG